ncbi:MAG: hypothetical protein ACD_58C00132G0012 [uncultured bacterium]|nr:MAG: hypothetical protein ACD_58C00132G0012 [uncultured bacterium]
MNPGMDFHPMDENKLMGKSPSGAYTRFKEPSELTQQEAMTIFVLEEELTKNRNLTDPQRGKLEEELLKLREKERFKENKEASDLFKIGAGWKAISENKQKIHQIENELLTGNLSDREKNERIKKLKELRESEIPLDGEQFKVLLKDIIGNLKSPALKKFIVESCVFDLNITTNDELNIDTNNGSDKFLISLSPKAFYEESQTKIVDKFGIERSFKFFNAGKVAYLIGQAIGHIFVEPENWKDVKPQIQFTHEGKMGSWEDFVAFCISSPSEAEKLSPAAFKFFRQRLDGLKDKKIPLKKEKQKINTSKFELDLRTDAEKDHCVDKHDIITKRLVEGTMQKFGTAKYDKATMWAIKWSKIKKLLWVETDWDLRAVSELENKEVSRIKARQEGIVDRDKSLRQLLNQGGDNIGATERFMLRTILLADMEFEDFSNERIPIYLQACDYLYRETHGEEITQNSYNFIVRLHRNSNAKGRRGTKPCEYRKVEIGEVYSFFNPSIGTYSDKVATSEVYVRKSRHKLMGDVLEEVNTFSGREISSVSKEFLEYLKIEDRHIGIDETWGKNQGKYGPGNQYKSATGNWKNHLGDSFTNKMFDNYNNRGDIPKLNPDQIAIIARVIAEEFKCTDEWQDIFGKDKKVQSIIYREHAKGALVEAYRYYKPMFLESDTYRGYVNYFLKISGAEVDQRGQISKIECQSGSDEDKLNNFIDSEKDSKNKDYDYDEAHQVLENYNNLEQEEKPLWEKDAYGNVKDVSANKLKREFIEKRSEREAAQDVDKLEKAMDKYINKVVEIIGKANLPLALREAIRDIALISNDVFILNDIKDKISQFDTGLLSSDEVYNTNQTVQEVVLALRPYRRELIQIKGLFSDLGIEYLGGNEETKKLASYPKEYGVQIELGRNFQKDAKGKDRLAKTIKTKKELIEEDKLSEDEKVKYDELKEKLVQINDKINKLAKDKAKKDDLKEAQKELTSLNEEIQPYLDKIGKVSVKGVLVELQEDIVTAINDIDSIIKDIDQYKNAIDKEIDDKVTKKYKNLIDLIPSKILEEAKNTEGEYDKTRIIMALKYISLFIEKTAQKIDVKPQTDKKDDKDGGKDRGKEKEESQTPIEDSD